MRRRADGLDGTDDSVWFVQGALASMANRTRGPAGSEVLMAYAIYVTEMLASTCEGVRVVVDVVEERVAEVCAVSDRGARQNVLSWVHKCVADPGADNIVFKYAGALRDFNERDRAARLDEQLREYAANYDSA
jgi:hypothetical protein